MVAHSEGNSGLLEIEVPIRVRYFETDKMGVVHHSNYLRYFEVARMEQFRHWGRPYESLEHLGFYMMVLKASCSYRLPAFFDEELLVKATVRRITRYRINHTYEVRNSERKIVATGETLLGCLNKDRVPIPLPDFLLEMRKYLEDRK